MSAEDHGWQFAVLMTGAMPRDVRDFGFYDDVWVTNYRSAIGFCTALRNGGIRRERKGNTFRSPEGW